MEVRLLSTEDAPLWWELRMEALETSPRAFSASPDHHRERGVAGCEPMLVCEENGSFVVGAFLDGKLVGSVGLVRNPNPKLWHSGFIWGVYVTDTARKQGVASALFEALLMRVRSYEGLERLTLDVDRESHRAMRLYEKFGFRSFGLEPNAMKVGGEYVDLHHMALDLR